MVCQPLEAWLARELRAAQADPDAAQPDAVSQGSDPGLLLGSRAAAQDAGGRRNQALKCRDRHMGKSGRDMLNALVSGTTDPVVLAELARGLLRKKIRRCARRCKGGSGPSTP